ncbi:MAG TPA: hypothetical protein VJH97_01060 [Candidatus Nanoarchaeia archaeon]|nr:hypothetical protein [Candidatus Nanoarchaeia archaeon]
MVKKIVWLLMCVILVISASAFRVSTETIKDTIALDELAEFSITITNDDVSPHDFRFVKLDYPYWDIYTKPLQNPLIITVPGSSSVTTKVYVDPLQLTEGVTDVNLKIQAVVSKDSKIVPLRVTVVEGSIPGGYVPTVLVNAVIPTKIDPRMDIKAQIHVDNQNILDYENLRIQLQSNTFSKQVNISLGPKEKKDFEILLRIDPKTPPQQDTVTLTALRNSQIVDGPKTTDIEIIPYTDITETAVPHSSFLKTKKDITFSNEGNAVFTGLVKTPTTTLKNLFTLANPRSKTVTEDGIKYIAWEVSIEPGQEFSVVVSENYMILLVLIILGLISLIAYQAYKSPIGIFKQADNLERSDGGITGGRVVILVKNKGAAPLKDIVITDRVPNIANVEKEVSLGTLQPSKLLKHEDKGSLIKWIIDDLDAGEERVITYRVKSVLPILGELNLPATIAHFSVKNAHKTAKSNSLTIS